MALVGFALTTTAESHGLIDCTHHHTDASTHEKSQKQDFPTKHLNCSCFSASAIVTQALVPFLGSFRSDEALAWKESFWPQLVFSPDLQPPRLS